MDISTEIKIIKLFRTNCPNCNHSIETEKHTSIQCRSCGKRFSLNLKRQRIKRLCVFCRSPDLGNGRIFLSWKDKEIREDINSCDSCFDFFQDLIKNFKQKKYYKKLTEFLQNTGLGYLEN